MYGNSPDLVGEKMVTPSVEFDPAIYWCLENFEEGVITHMNECRVVTDARRLLHVMGNDNHSILSLELVDKLFNS